MSQVGYRTVDTAAAAWRVLHKCGPPALQSPTGGSISGEDRVPVVIRLIIAASDATLAVS